MTASGASMSSYLRQHRIRFAEQTEYHVSPHVDLICFQADQLAQMNAQPLHAFFLLKAMLHIPGSAIEQILTQNSLTLEKVHATPLNQSDLPLEVDRFFKRTVSFTQGRASIASWHLLLALLDEETLQPYFAAWRVDPQKLRNAALDLSNRQQPDR